MQLFYDARDDAAHESRGSRLLYWLDDLDASPITEATPHDSGFVFAGARPIEDYRSLVERLPRIRDRPEDRAPLLALDSVLDALADSAVDVPMARSWRLPIDTDLPTDLSFPLFLRTTTTSLKLGGRTSKVNSIAQLESEMGELRRLLGWDALIIAREWLDLAPAGACTFDAVPQEIRTWVVDGEPLAWSFHYLGVVRCPAGFPPAPEDLATLASLARAVGSAFHSRLVVADFARDVRGEWTFIEAGPGSCAGTAHESVFKLVASALRGDDTEFVGDSTGGRFR